MLPSRQILSDPPSPHLAPSELEERAPLLPPQHGDDESSYAATASLDRDDDDVSPSACITPHPIDIAGVQLRKYGGTKEVDRVGSESACASESSTERAQDDGENDNVSVESDAQAGVKQIEAISQTWTRWSLISAYIGILLLAVSTSLEQQTTTNLTAYATASFDEHSLVSTVYLVSSVVMSVIKPPMSKIANTFGRLEAYCFAVVLYICGYIQMAGSNNFQTFASAQIFYSAGSQGLQMLQQIFIADTSNLLTRALFSSLPDTPFLFTTWLGSPIAESLLQHASWRWGYGIWAIVLPVAFTPLALSLFLSMRKAVKKGLIQPRPWKTGQSFGSAFKRVWDELDITGLLLLSAAIALLLLPLTFASKTADGYKTPWIIAMLVVGGACWILFPLWELTPKLAPHPFLSLRMLQNRNVVCGCVLAFWYFGVFYLSVQPYFYTYLQVVQFQSITAAGRITQIFSFSSTIGSLVISLLIWKTKHFKWFIVFGACSYMVAVGLIMQYRDEDATLAQLVIPQIMLGISGGFIHVPAQLAVQAAVGHSDVAAATALFLTLLEIGGAVGNAISGAIWTANILKKLKEYLPADSKHLAPAIFGDPFLAKEYPRGSPIRDAVNRSFQETMSMLLVVALGFAAMTLIMSFSLKNVQLDQVDQKQKGRATDDSTQQTDDDRETRSHHAS